MNTRPIAGLIAAAATLICATAGAAQTAGPMSGALRAGAAKADITPPANLLPIQGGQLFSSVHDPIFVRALVLDNGGTKVALVSLDTADLPGGDELVKAVMDELHVRRENVILDATHDHNTPTGGHAVNTASPYFAVMRKGVVEAVRQANARLQPARVGFGRGKAYVNVNRDEKIGEDYHMGYAPDGPSDKTVAVVTVTTPAGAPIAVYANYAVHGVVMFLVKSRDGQYQITGDLPGATSAYVEERLGNGAVALWTSGAAGDQNPLFQGDYNQDAPDVFDEGPAAWALLDVQARRLGQEIVRVAKATDNTTDRAVLWGAVTSVTCPGQRPITPLPVGQAPHKTPMTEGGPVAIPLALLMINDIALAGVSGEPFTEIGEHLKAASPFDRTMMVTLLPNGAGYIPTDRAYTLPSLMAVANSIKPGCAEPAMIGAFQKMMGQYMPAWKAAK